jgi:hypothetical protein
MAKKQLQLCLTLNAERDFQGTPSEATKRKNESINKPSNAVIYSHLNHLFSADGSFYIPNDHEKKLLIRRFLNIIIN